MVGGDTSSKTGQEKVQYNCKDDLLFLSSYYLSMVQRICAQYSTRISKQFVKPILPDCERCERDIYTYIVIYYTLIQYTVVLTSGGGWGE